MLFVEKREGKHCFWISNWLHNYIFGMEWFKWGLLLQFSEKNRSKSHSDWPHVSRETIRFREDASNVRLPKATSVDITLVFANEKYKNLFPWRHLLTIRDGLFRRSRPLYIALISSFSFNHKEHLLVVGQGWCFLRISLQTQDISGLQWTMEHWKQLSSNKCCMGNPRKHKSYKTKYSRAE